MPVIKLSVVGQGSELDEVIELDDGLFGRLRETVDAQPDLTMGEAIRRGLQHVVDEGPLGGGSRQ
jgi:hypothetical protein